MKLTVLFGSEADMQRLDHHQLIKDWSIDQMFCTDRCDLKFVTAIRNLTLAPFNAVIRTTDPHLTMNVIELIRRTHPKVDFIPAQSLFKPRRLPVLPFAPRGFGKSVEMARALADCAGVKLPEITECRVDEAPMLTANEIRRDFLAGIDASLRQTWEVDTRLIPWDHPFEGMPDAKFESIADEIRQKQIRAVQEFERKYPGVPWEVHTGPVHDIEHETFAPRKMESYKNEYTFTVRPKFPVAFPGTKP